MENKIDVYYDGDCGVCTRIARRIIFSARNQQFQFHNIRTGALPPGVSMESAIRHVHALDDGELYRGGDVVPRIILRYPRWRWLGRIASVPPLIWALYAAYVLLARNRGIFKHFI